MDLKELIKSLRKQEEGLKKFFDCSVNKQQAIIKSDIDTLQELLIIEENLLCQLEEQSVKVAEALRKVSDEYELKLDTFSLSEFLDSVNLNADTNLKVISLLRNSIRELVTQSSKVNNQNKVLIEHSRNFLKETISNLASLNNQTLLDTRI